MSSIESVLTKAEATALIAYIRALEEEAGLEKHVGLSTTERMRIQRMNKYWTNDLMSALEKIHDAVGPNADPQASE